MKLLYTIFIILIIVEIYNSERLCENSTDEECRCKAVDGECIPQSSCNGETGWIKYGLCPGSTYCCLNYTDTPDLSNVLSDEDFVKFRNARGGINIGIDSAANSYIQGYLGSPGDSCLSQECTYTSPCSCSGNFSTYTNTIRLDNGISITGLPAFITSIERVFDKMRIYDKAIWNQMSTSGAYCCRGIRTDPPRLTTTFSNHAFGLAIDLRSGPAALRSTQEAISRAATFFEEEKFYWLAQDTGNYDAMHFQASENLINQWETTCEGGTMSNCDVSDQPVYGKCESSKNETGNCIHIEVCNRYDGEQYVGLCPGPSQIRCCVIKDVENTNSTITPIPNNQTKTPIPNNQTKTPIPNNQTNNSNIMASIFTILYYIISFF